MWLEGSDFVRRDRSAPRRRLGGKLMRNYILLAGGAALLVALSVGVATATAGRGKSANAHLCQKGGWMSLQGSDGTQYANQGACVRYGAHGGTIVPIPPTLSISY